MKFRKFFIILIPLLLFGCVKKKVLSSNENPKRIVCLSPGEAEILCAIGAENLIVARTDFCDYPESLKSKPSVGGFDGKSLNIEAIISKKPDLVYGSKGMHDFLKQPLENMGVKVYLSDPYSFEALYDEIRCISKMTDLQENGDRLISQIQDDIGPQGWEEYKQVYFEIMNNPYMTCGSTSFLHNVIVFAGGSNIFSDLKSPYPMINEEEIIKRNPQVIIIPEENGITFDSLKKRSGWTSIDAVKNNRIIFVDASLVCRPGPRIGKATSDLAKKIQKLWNINLYP
ncbi:MAG: helical backbone metal receptor [Treponema sp.]|nr:helical backbone metal receptor [Treponema sp.]